MKLPGKPGGPEAGNSWARLPCPSPSPGACSKGMSIEWVTPSNHLITFTFHFHALEKEMATHSSVLVWRIPGTGEPGGLPSMVSHRVGHTEVT